MGEAKQRADAGLGPRSCGQLHVRDPEYRQDTGSFVVPMEFRTGFMMTEEHIQSATLWGSAYVKQLVRMHDLGPHSWPAHVEVMPSHDMKGAVLIFSVICHECRAPGPWLN